MTNSGCSAVLIYTFRGGRSPCVYACAPGKSHVHAHNKENGNTALCTIIVFTSEEEEVEVAEEVLLWWSNVNNNIVLNTS